MTENEADDMLARLGNEWAINGAGHLTKHYSFKDFADAMSFANQVGELAEEVGHHPDLTIAWGRCGIEIWTHKINGLADADFILAAKADRLYRPLP